MSASSLDLLGQIGSSSSGLVVSSGDKDERQTWQGVIARAEIQARALSKAGLAPGCHAEIVGSTSAALISALFASWILEASATIAGPSHPAAAIPATHRLTIDPGGEMHLQETGRQRLLLPPGTVMVQPTSGTTGSARGVCVTADSILANWLGTSQTLGFNADDRFVSWLPLFHDMGLIGFVLFPALCGASAHLIPTEVFSVRPRRWLEVLAEVRGTVSGAPSSAFAIATRLLGEKHALEAWRMAINGGELVDPIVARQFLAAAAKSGVNAGALRPAYGMAEATLAVAFGRCTESGVALDIPPANSVGGWQFSTHGLPLAAYNELVPGLKLRVVGDDGVEAVKGHVGEVEISGSSVAAAHVSDRGVELLAREGWLATGDIGYDSAKGLVICGRKKDVVAIGGRNFVPTDLERVVSDIPGVRDGRVGAVGVYVPGLGECLYVVAETRISGVAARARLSREIRHAANPLRVQVVLVEPDSLPRTSSGKIQRGEVRERVEADLNRGSRTDHLGQPDLD